MATLAQRFTLKPVSPTAIREEIDDGNVLVTTDIPDYLGRPVATSADTGIALYRLVQLFGTPNLPGLEAGTDQPMRELMTWQYLFRVEYLPDRDAAEEPDPVTSASTDGERPTGSNAHTRRSALVSVYDYRTTLSVGLSTWHRSDDQPPRVAVEPSAEPLPSTSMPDETFLEQLVQLVLSTVEHAVEATWESRHI